MSGRVGTGSLCSTHLQSATPISRRALLRGSAALAGCAGASLASPLVSSLSPAVRAAQAKFASEVRIEASLKKNIVETDSGKVFGFVRNDIYAFKGMPYGGTTAGKNRFMAPTKPTPWTGVRGALYWGPAAPQVSESTMVGRRLRGQSEGRYPSEDCLRVNVWTPSFTDNKKRPVLVWIHGGGYTSGSDIENTSYDGENLSRRGDVVVVSLNHRLNVLGYVNLSSYGEKWADAGNAGMLDIVAALHWVKTNISNFGGDPNSVMIFGQSGGGGKVSTLMGMPAAQGLFHRAVVESGSPANKPAGPDRSPDLAAALIAELGLTANTIDKIQDLPNETIEEAAVVAPRKLQTGPPGARGTGGGGVGWTPIVDGKNIPQPTWYPGAPTMSATVPLMVGTVLNEFFTSALMGDPTLDDMSMDEAKRRLSVEFKDRTEHIVEVFHKNHPQETPFALFSRISCSGTSRESAVTQAERKTALNAAPAYLYWFQWQTPVLDKTPRAYHTSELAFVFKNTDRCASQTGGGAGPRVLAAKMADAWINFARNGDPNHSGLPQWPKFKKEQCPTMIFDDECVMKNNPDTEERKLVAS
jgi:para-nitrobenzyl esterase